MTTDFSQPSSCLDPELLSALVAGQVSGTERTDALAHIASCRDCHEVFADLLRMSEDANADAASPAVAQARGADSKVAIYWTSNPVAKAPAASSTRTPGARAAIYWSMAIAASLIAVLWVGWRVYASPDRQLQRAVTQLASAVDTNRATEARLAGGFLWGPVPLTTRGGSTTELPLAVQDAVLSIKKLAEGQHSARALDAVGVSYLLAGDIGAALTSHDKAVAADPSNATATADLAAARLERWRRSREAADAASAVDAAERAVEASPRDAVARFNHALAIEALGVASASIESWKAYLAIDSTSEWAGEAKQHLARLEGGVAPVALAAPASMTPAELATTAQSSPWLLEEFLSRTWLPSWRARVSTSTIGESADDAVAVRVGDALRAADRDRYLPDVVRAAVSPRLSNDQRACLARATAGVSDALDAFAVSKTADAEAAARQAHDAFVCAQVPTVEADALTAYTAFFQNKRASALALAETVAPIATAAGYQRSLGRVRYIQGLNHVYEAHLSDAETGYEQATAAFDQAGEIGLGATVWALRAEVSWSMGDMAGAWTRLSRALATLPSLSTRRQHIVLVNASIHASRVGLTSTARVLADAAVEADRHGTDPVLLMGGYLQSAIVRHAAGDETAAMAELDEARSVFPTIADATMRAQFDAEFNALSGQILTGRRPAEAVTALTAAIKGFGASGREGRRAHLLLDRGRAYRAAGNLQDAERDWSAGAALFEDQRPSIREAQLRIDHQDQLWDLFRELIDVRAADPVASLEVAERFRGRALLDALSTSAELPPLSGAAMHDWLPARVVVVAYAMLPDRLLRWTITRADVRVDQAAVSSKDLTALVERYRSGWLKRRAGATSVDATAGELSQLLLPKLDPAAIDRLVFLPDGPLFTVPFATLPIGGTSRIVLDDFVASVAPSLTVLKLAQGSRPRGGPLRALLAASGEVQPREALPALPGVVAEVQSVASLYTAPDLLMGRDLTASAMLKDLARADVVHFAGHAVADPLVPARSRLLLSPGAEPSTLSFNDLRTAPMRRGAVVVLSACDAARGRVFHGEGVVGLTYPFLANGASSVVAALWPIDDAVPLEFWRHFHQRILAGAAPDVALAESQRISRTRGNSPAMWAAFEVAGGLAHQ
jgi:CHAT domain-containing protein/tetratricopeptide (TPR) repeat protein